MCQEPITKTDDELLNQILWKYDFTRDTSAINLQNQLENFWPQISFKSPRGQRFNFVNDLI